jgi:hypothetical protein
VLTRKYTPFAEAQSVPPYAVNPFS